MGIIYIRSHSNFSSSTHTRSYEVRVFLLMAALCSEEKVGQATQKGQDRMKGEEDAMRQHIE